MTGLEIQGYIAAIPIGLAALAKAVQLGKQLGNGKQPNGGFTSNDRECLHHIERTKGEQTKILGEIRDNTRDLLQYFRKGIG